MGDIADMLIDNMEQGESVIHDKITGETFTVSNMDIMYTSKYNDTDRYKITEDY